MKQTLSGLLLRHVQTNEFTSLVRPLTKICTKGFSPRGPERTNHQGLSKH
jgi:hypothetical protein